MVRDQWLVNWDTEGSTLGLIWSTVPLAWRDFQNTLCISVSLVDDLVEIRTGCLQNIRQVWRSSQRAKFQIRKLEGAETVARMASKRSADIYLATLRRKRSLGITRHEVDDWALMLFCDYMDCQIYLVLDRSCERRSESSSYTKL
jgi:hypothetical protein